MFEEIFARISRHVNEFGLEYNRHLIGHDSVSEYLVDFAKCGRESAIPPDVVVQEMVDTNKVWEVSYWVNDSVGYWRMLGPTAEYVLGELARALDEEGVGV